MDPKGISWVGNFYEKFEAMCLEVEEIMYQDTVKYVENQVQKVGSSVKKFYSDVMQDLLPPSSGDPAKGADSGFPLEFYTDVGIYTKPKFEMMEKNVKVDAQNKLTEDQKKTTNYNSDYPPTFHRVSHVDNLFPLSQEDSAGGVKGSLSNKSNLRTRKNSRRENVSPNEKSGAILPMGKDLNRESSFCEPSNENHLADSAVRASKQNVEGFLSGKPNLATTKNSKRENTSRGEISGIVIPLGKSSTTVSSACKHPNQHHDSFDQTAKSTPSGSVEEMRPDVMAERKNEIEIASEKNPDIPRDGQLTDVVSLAESGMSKETDMRASSCGTLLPKTNAVDTCPDDGVTSLTESYTNWQVENTKIASNEDFASNSGKIDDWNTEVSDIDTSIIHEMEIIQEVDKAKLEESCIMVNRDDFHFVPCYEGKRKSYQKKIRNVFSPRKSSTRKHEYEQLAMCSGSDSNSKTLKDAKRLPTPDFSETEWELL